MHMMYLLYYAQVSFAGVVLTFGMYVTVLSISLSVVKDDCIPLWSTVTGPFGAIFAWFLLFPGGGGGGLNHEKVSDPCRYP